MPCEWLKMADGTVMHIRRSRSGAKKHCKFCSSTYKAEDGKVCDFPVEHGKTCDADMCSHCSVTLGHQDTDIGAGLKRMGDTIDLCPIHRTMAVVRDGKLELTA